MGLFSKGKRDVEDTERLYTETNSQPVTTTHIDPPAPPVIPEVDDMEYARTAIEQFSVELRDSSAKQQSAIKRISTLNSAISKMELDLKALRRVQAENRDYSKNVAELESKLSQKISWANLDQSKATLAASRDQETAYQAQNASHERTIRALTAKFQTAEDKINHSDSTIDKMQDRLDNQIAELAQRERQIVELRNTLDEVNEKYSQKSTHSDSTTVELKNLKADYADLKSRHVEATGQLENMKYDLGTQKNVFDENPGSY